MAVLLSILKITGIVLLIILLAFLAVVACILFVPVRYQGSGDIEAKEYKARISWMLGLIQFRAEHTDQEELRYGIYILGRRTGILDPGQREKRKGRKEKKQAKKREKEKAKFQKKREKQKSRITLDPEGGTERKQEPARKPEAQGQTEASGKQPEQTAGPEIKSTAFETQEENRVSRVWKICKKVLEIVKDIRDKNLIGLLLPKVKRLFYHIRPRKLKAELTFGFSDPSVTGKVLGGISWLFFLYQYEEFILVPDFETDETYIRGTFQISGHIRIIHLLIFALGILKEKEFRAFIKSLKLN